jgi:cytochrome o ubiquinol oxidase operon protein cyoD
MSRQQDFDEGDADTAPGDHQTGDENQDVRSVIGSYVIGLGLATALTLAAFWVASGSSLLYGPGIPMALAALAVGQMGVHLVFFLHITTGPGHLNNVLALAFGVFVIGIVIAGSVWIMFHLNGNMMPAAMMHLPTQP